MVEKSEFNRRINLGKSYLKWRDNMPLKRCTTSDGKSGWQYGNQKCWGSRREAVQQMRAIKVSQQKQGKADLNDPSEELAIDIIEYLESRQGR